MAKKMLIDATHAEETRIVVVDGNKVEEFDFESENKRQLAGNIYLAKVTRVEPSLQAAFVDYGGNRHGFLAFSEIHPDYYQIPVADREALLEEERAYAKSLDDEEENKPSPKKRRSRSRSKSKAEDVKSEDAIETKDTEINGMDLVDLGEETLEGSSPMELVAETPVETPASEESVDDEAVSENDEQPVTVDASEEDNAVTQAADDDSDDEDTDSDANPRADASEKDDQIESVADEDVTEEIRQPRKPRVRRYKIQEVIKVRQILLVQVVKEERGNKGAALTTYLSLAGRYCVLMPNTARGGGISRKITNAADRKKLKEIATEIDVPQGAGLIIRTAGAQRTKSEIKRDYEYLQRLWEQIRELTLKSTAPAKIYEEGDLIKRSIRDLYNREIDEVFVEGEAGYRVAKDFMKMIMPSHAKNVKRYHEALPLFARFQVETYLAGMFNPTVQLKSGGYIVIGVTEALVAIDVNSGRATKENSIEETATKTNLEAAEEVARQLRLRDLAGLIVIDFIDMEDRRNNAAVEKRMKDKLKTDRARIQIGRISGFGLMEMSRQRLRPGMIETTTQPCHHCHGTGLIRSDDNLALSILRQLEEEGVRRRSREVLLKAPIGIMNFLMNNKREHIAQIEGRYGLSVRVEADPHLVSPDFTIERFKTATRVVPVTSDAVVSVDTSLMDQIDSIEEAEVVAEAPAANGEEQAPQPKKRRRRRRRRRSGNGQNQSQEQETGSADTEAAESHERDEGQSPEPVKAAEAVVSEPTSDSDATVVVAETAEAESEKKPRKRAPRRRTPKAKVAETDVVTDAAPETVVEEVVTTDNAAVETEAQPAKKPARKRAPAKPRAKSKAALAKEAKQKETAASEEGSEAKENAEPDLPAPEPVAISQPVSIEPAADETTRVAALSAAPSTTDVSETAEPKSKKKGWWSLGR